MKGSLRLGKVSNVSIEIHWTFVLILFWVVFSELKSGGTAENAFMSVIFVLLLFVCVVLHEFGHILTARKFGSVTRKITLLPIGGVASMDKIPEKPRQELLVAIAGPAVNIAISLLLLFFVPISFLQEQDTASLEAMLERVTFQNILFFLFAANIMLAVFNFIPAFPMDGGRIFRALVAMKVGRVRATRIAAALGQMLAVVFFFIGLFYNPFLIFIALFIFLGAFGENQYVQQEALIKDRKVGDAMMTNFTILSPEESVGKAIALLISGTEKNFIVMNGSEIAGIAYQNDIIKNAHQKSLAIKELMETTYEQLDVSTPLKEAFLLMNRHQKQFFPVVENRSLVGAIDITNLSEFILIQSKLIDAAEN